MIPKLFKDGSEIIIRFVAGKDSSPLQELFKHSKSVGGLKKDLLVNGETYGEKGQPGTEKTVSLEEKLESVYEAVFKDVYVNGTYEVTVGECAFTKETRDIVLRIANAMSEYVDYK